MVLVRRNQQGPPSWTSVPAPAHPERQRALPDDPGACPHCGACAWRRNGTYPRHLVVLGRLRIQRWQCKACLGSASPLPPDVSCVSFRGLSHLLSLLGCGVGAVTPWRDVQSVAPGLAPDPQADLRSWVEVDETWLSLGGVKRPVAVVLGPQGERLDRQPCAVHMQRTVGRHIRGLDEDDLTHGDRVLLPILRRLARERPPEAGPVLLALWEAVMQGRVRLQPEVRKLLWHLGPARPPSRSRRRPPRATGWRHPRL